MGEFAYICGMKVRIPYRISLIVLAAVALLSVFSCSERGRYADSVMAAADSLMMSDPHAALDTLMTIDSAVAAGMTTKQKAFYALLGTEGRYKCYLPVAEDTAIFDAIGYYHRHGPEGLLARSLMMGGAVLEEREEPLSALEVYLKAEPIFVDMEDNEQLGLLNTRIGGLYLSTYVNNEEAVSRYRKALECFGQCGNEERVMYAHLSLARALVSESPDSAFAHILEGMRLARKYEDSFLVLEGYELLAQIYLQKQDYRGIIRISEEAVESCGRRPEDPVSESLWQSLLFNKALSYASLGKADSAIYVSSYLRWSDSAEDRMMRHWLASAMAESRKDWRTALIETRISEAMADSIEKEGARLQLENREFMFTQDINEKEQENDVLRLRIFTVSAVSLFLFVVCLSAFLFSHNRALRVENENLRLSITSYGVQENEELERHIRSMSPENEDAQNELRSILSSMLALVKDLNEMCWQENCGTGTSNVKELVNRYFPKGEVYLRIRRVCDIIHPSKLSEIETEVPVLTDTDKLLIALMGCGFPTGAICALMRLTKASLNVQKTRTARKIGPKVRLSEYVSEKFSKNIG